MNFKIPIAPGEVFNPEEELKKVRQAAKEERWQKLQEFKNKLVYQKEGLARLQIRVIAAINENPDASFEQLYQIVENEGVKYGITEEQKEVAKSILRAYIEKHEQIRKIRKEYPDDAELYQALFRRTPAGKIKVEEGPMTLYFRCENIRDFTRIATKAHLWGGNFTQQDVKKSQGTAGIFMPESLVPGLNGTISAEKSWVFSSGIRMETMCHEKQHATDNLFRNVACHAIYKRLLQYKRARKRSSFEYYWRFCRQPYEEIAGSEIMAAFRTGEDPKYIFRYLTEPANKDGLYDWLAKKRRHVAKVARYFGEQPDLAEAVAKEIFETEYHRLFALALDAFEGLIKTRYSTEEAIAIFVHEPLARWQKVAKRLTESKNISCDNGIVAGSYETTSYEIVNGWLERVSGPSVFYGARQLFDDTVFEYSDEDLAMPVEVLNGTIDRVKVRELNKRHVFTRQTLLQNPALLEKARAVVVRGRNLYLKIAKKCGLKALSLPSDIR